jgi:hypothetical protein
MTEPAPTVESETDFGSGDAASARRWISEIELAERHETKWRKAGELVIRRYKDERPNEKQALNPARKFSILWSNVQTLGPAVYARTPKCVVSRRFKDEDPVARQASEVLERAVNYSLEEYDFDELMCSARLDYLLPGRGTVWVRYQPELAPGQDPESADPEVTDASEDPPSQEVTYERVLCDHVSWNDFLTNPAREWAEVRWVARRVFMTREELVERFGDKGKRCPLDWEAKANTPEQDEQFRKAIVYEIWDKPSGQAIWINKAFSTDVLDTRPDPLNLTGFFPCPRPLLATLGPDSLIPVPDYVLYQDQAQELDELTGRIGTLTDALRLVGFYAAKDGQKLQNVFGRDKNNTLIPVESWAEFSAGGGVKGMLEWVPIDMAVQCLEGCFNARAKIVEDIYQITGISDIMRGDTDPLETAAAQKLKGQWGSLRVRDRQKELARFARDICRIKGEIISEFFSPETLKKMTNLQMFDSPEQKQQVQAQLQQQAQMAQQQAAMAQQQGGQPPPQPQPPSVQVQKMLADPTWAEVMQLLRDNAMRSFRIDIETDSTIDPNDEAEKQAATEFVTAIGTLIGQAKQAPPPLYPLLGETIKFLARRYRAGRELEEVIDQTVEALQQMPPPSDQQPQGDPTALPVAQTEQQTESIKQQGESQRMQMQAQMQRESMPLEMLKEQNKVVALQRDPQPQVVSQQ